MIKSINVDVDQISGQWRKDKALNSAQAMLLILQSKEFKDKILNMNRSYWLKGESRSSTFKKMSNEQIYNKLMRADEEWNKVIDYEIDMKIKSYTKTWSGVVGFMNPGKPLVWVNTKFFDTFKEVKVASNLTHEWGHTMGSRHSGDYFRQSLPYYLNKCIESLYPVVIQGKAVAKPRTKKVCKRIWWMPWRKRCVTKVVG